MLCGVGGECAFGEVNLGEGLGVACLERRKYLSDALADDVTRENVRLDGGHEFSGPGVQGAIFDRTAPVEVDDGVAQDAVEPGCGGLA